MVEIKAYPKPTFDVVSIEVPVNMGPDATATITDAAGLRTR